METSPVEGSTDSIGSFLDGGMEQNTEMRQTVDGLANQIFVEQSFSQIECLQQKRIEKIGEEKVFLGEDAKLHRVLSNPGSYCPVILLEAAELLILKKDFDQAAVLLTAAFHRAEIDVRLSQDKKAVEVLTDMLVGFDDKVRWLSEEDLAILREKSQEKLKAFEAWDRNTPRAYDASWLGQYSSESISFPEMGEASKNAVIERYYRELRGEYRPEDAINASVGDTYYFNSNTRQFCLRKASFIVSVPEGIQPIIGRFGKFTKDFKLPNGTIEIYRGYRDSFEAAFEAEFRDWGREPRCEVIRCTVGNGIDAVKTRVFLENEDAFFDHYYTLVHDGHAVFIRLYCIPENEAECLPYLNSLLDSAEFLSN